jgi:hypothetical protein
LFDRVKEHLNDNGVFVVDVNTITKLDMFSTFAPSRLTLEKGYQLAKIVKTEDGIYHWKLNIHMPQKDGTEKITENDIPEDALRKRFRNVERFTPDGKEPDESAFRVYFACSI